MEASISTVTWRGDRILVLTAGKFGERWADLGKAYGCKVEVVKAEYGQTFPLEAVRQKLSADVRVVYREATESSNGGGHDVHGVGKLLRDAKHEALLVVDAITGLGTTTFDVDGWGLDIVIGGSQKAVMIPPGLAFLSVSERAWQRMETTKSPRYYFDLRKERKAASKGESAFTPATSLIAGLGAAFDFIRTAGNGDLAAGRDALIANAELAAAMTRAAASALDLELYAPTAPAAALTAIIPPAGIGSGVFVKGFRELFDTVIANGAGDMKGKLFRLAHLGYLDYLDTIPIIDRPEPVAAQVAPAHNFQFGRASS